MTSRTAESTTSTSESLPGDLPTIRSQSGFASDTPSRLPHQAGSDEFIDRTFDNYHIDDFLGAGSMGRVYLARHLNLHRRCALKVLPRELVDHDDEYLSQFHREGQAAAALSHPNIITVHACGEHEGLHFLEMEFIAGLSLKRMILDEGAQRPERAARIAARVAEGLAAAHQSDILHRDLKPDNVMMTLQSVPKICDFGLARRVRNDHGEVVRDELAGTPPYMAPELFNGAPASTASDVYSLGVTLFQLLTGRLPYESQSINELIRMARDGAQPSVKTLAPTASLDLIECVHRMLERAPENRPANGYEAAALLSAVLETDEELEELVRRAFVAHPQIRWSREGDRFRVQLALANGRRQVAYVEESDHAAADRLVTISSVCSPPVERFFGDALRLNGQMSHGAIGIRDVDGRPKFVMLDHYPRSTVDAEEIRRSVLEVAQRADAVELALTGADFH